MGNWFLYNGRSAEAENTFAIVLGTSGQASATSPRVELDEIFRTR